MFSTPVLRASLEPPESNPQVSISDDAKRLLDWSSASTFRHSGWRHTRARVFRAMSDTDATFSAMYEFAYCGKHAYVLRSTDDPSKYRVAGSSCHQRFCLPCASERSRTIAINVLDRLGRKRARFLTLTIRSTTESLTCLLDKLTHSFAQLRRRALWRKRVTGGVSFIELKWLPDSQRWNVHLHAIIQGRYVEQGHLAKAWKQITRDSIIIDIRAIKDNRTVTRYVTKYACKPLHFSVLHDDAKLREAMIALKGRRLATTFGDWRGVLLTPKPDEEAWTNLGSLETMIRQATSGDPTAVAICRSLSVTIAPTVTTSAEARAPPANSVDGGEQSYLNLNCLVRHVDIG